MKQDINLGTALDSGTGDYLRRGGRKINENFGEVYNQLGDSNIIQPANLGIRYFTAGIDGNVLNAEIGQIYAIDAGAESVTVNLPNVTSTDIGRGCIFMDPFGTWNVNNVSFVTSGTATFGATNQFTSVVRYAKVNMVFTNPNLWAFNSGQRLDQFSDVAEASRYVRYRIVEQDGETDFMNVFPIEYNDAALDVIVNGTDLFYGNNFSSLSEFGSIDDDNITALNGYDIRIREPLSKGDIVKFVTYTRSTGTSPTSVEDYTIQLLPDTSTEDAVTDKVIKADLSQPTVDLLITDIGGSSTAQFNIDATFVYVDGVKLTRAGTADLPLGSCTVGTYDTESTCTANGGTWTHSYDQFQVIINDGVADTIRINTDNLDEVNGNRITVKTFNYIIGTLTPIDQVVAESDLRYMRTTDFITRKNKISYSDPENPTNATVVNVPGTESIRFDSFTKMFDTLYPVGTLYTNTHNPANPADYMGVGVWERYAEGRSIVGWDSRTTDGVYDPDFGLNNNDLNNLGIPQPSAGATRGGKTKLLTLSNIPILSAAGQWLRRAAGNTGFFKNFGDFGNVEAVSSYNEEVLSVGSNNPTPVNVIQPSVTVYAWVRVA